MSTIRLHVSSCQASNAEYVNRAVTRYLQARLIAEYDGNPQYSLDYVDTLDWRERYRQLDQGNLHIVHI
jgi:hypothetical protein